MVLGYGRRTCSPSYSSIWSAALMIVYKSVEFDAAHKLPNYPGKCSNLHGHRWTIELGVEGKVNRQTGMVIDFKEIKAFLTDIYERFDHKYLNDFFDNPTAECIAVYVAEKALDWSEGRLVKPVIVRVWEGPGSYVEIEVGKGEE
jgi:6-pyruvoyltetrahydropterin/6-carboxytetrahydropterin synthase